MIESVLVADRGLLAVRVLTGLRELGVTALACYLAADEQCRHVQVCDEAIPVGDADPLYLADALVEAAQVTGAGAVHAGSGRWVGDAGIAAAVRAAGLAWIGPDSGPGGPFGSGEQGVTLSRGTVLDGWRWTARDGGSSLLAESFDPDPAGRREAEAAVDPELPVASVELAAGSGTTRVRGGLIGLDRLVEARTGANLLERQLRAASGLDPLGVGQPSGHAVQAALYAVAPGAAPVRGWVVPDVEGVVVDTVLAEGAQVGATDTVLALFTAYGEDRPGALARLARAVDGTALDSPASSLAALRALLRGAGSGSMVG